MLLRCRGRHLERPAVRQRGTRSIETLDDGEGVVEGVLGVVEDV